MNDTINEILNNSDFLITVSDSINNSIHQLNIDLLKNQNEVLNSINQLKRPNYSLLLIGALIGALIGYLISLLHDRVRIRKKLKNYKKRYEESLDCFDKVLLGEPDNIIALNGKAECLAKLKR